MNLRERQEPAGKAARIIEAARDAFLEQGYDAISMDEIARRAGVAKQTVYSHFPGKDALFLAVHERERRQFDRLLEARPMERPEEARAALSEKGMELLEVLLSASLRALLRVSVAAAHRFPSLGKSIYEGGVKQREVQLAGIFERAVAAGALRADDAGLAAEHFTALVRGELFLHCLFDPSFTPSRAEMERQVAEAVDCFLVKYGVEAGKPSAGPG